MSLFLGALTILVIVIALIFLFKKIFTKKNKGTSSSQDIASEEVLKKEVSEFDVETGDEKPEDKDKKDKGN